MNLKHKKIMLWDFDGVLLNSNSIRDLGFNKTLESYPDSQVELLLDYHRKNGGLSRYQKFRYFFEDIRQEQVDGDKIQTLAANFSKIMLKMLKDKSLIITDSLHYIKNNYLNKNMHIVSASDQNELRELCRYLEIDTYFNSIHGSPTTKVINVTRIIETNRYNKEDVILVGDSINDLHAATDNSIDFIGYNNPSLKAIASNYFENFKNA